LNALTVKQPAAAAILAGVKQIEYRTWSTTYRGLLAIHAGRTPDPDPGPYAEVQGADVLAAVLGTVCLTACDWSEEDSCYHWLLSDPRPLTVPHHVKGRQSLWTIPPAVVDVRLARPGTFLYVGRANRRYRLKGSPFGNPDRGRGDDPATALQRYREHVLARPDLVALLPSLRGQVLGCWCGVWNGVSEPALACHAAVLVQLADGPLGSPAT
jgi:hypothetical protein